MCAILLPTLNEERELWSRGLVLVAGVDEAGAGAWAGPVYAGAVILKAGSVSLDRLIRDSKMLSPSQRSRAAELVKAEAVAWAVGFASAEEIDRINIRRADELAMLRAIGNLGLQPEFVLIDAFRLPGLSVPSKSIIRGDAHVGSIAAASIMAKVARDTLMAELAERHPGYGFERHKGYGTAAHHQALLKLGPCAEHRRSYEPIKKLMTAAS